MATNGNKFHEYAHERQTEDEKEFAQQTATTNENEESAQETQTTNANNAFECLEHSPVETNGCNSPEEDTFR
jgi:hypothetical protein